MALEAHTPVYGDDGTAVTGANTYYSRPSIIKRLADCSYDLYWTGGGSGNVGTFTVQISNKENPVLTSDTDWKTLTLAVAIVQPNGTNTGDYVDLSDLPFRWVRLKYVNSSGSGTVLGFFCGKGS